MSTIIIAKDSTTSIIIYTLFHFIMMLIFVPAISTNYLTHKSNIENYILFVFISMQCLSMFFCFQGLYSLKICSDYYSQSLDETILYNMYFFHSQIYKKFIILCIITYLLLPSPLLYLVIFGKSNIQCYQFNQYTCYLSIFIACIGMIIPIITICLVGTIVTIYLFEILKICYSTCCNIHDTIFRQRIPLLSRENEVV